MPRSASPPAIFGPARCLVAERSPTMGLAIAAWLRGWGHQAETVRTEAAARAALAAASFDLLIADAAFALPGASVPRLTLVSPGQVSTGPILARPVQAQALREAVENCLAPLLPPIDGGPDIAAIAELWGAPDSPAFKRISAVFLAEAPIRLAAIVTAHAAADRAKLSHEAHALAGAALNVGLPEVVRLARVLEHADPGRPLAELAPDLLALQEVAIRDFDALQALANPA
jgi:HPt (histidine-containing phosphotransfer) domain-containing protein